MVAALPPDGQVITLEVDEETAAMARRHIDASPQGSRVELIVGDALETLDRLDGPFDLVYIDAWKSDYPAYYEAVLPKLSGRGAIVADNLFRDGLALTPEAEFARQVQEDERVRNVLLTIGDGVMLVWPRPAGVE
jgi:caffeoyl-CoA O-methyltransferase